jgi:Rod binding domain-containing protein
MNIAPNLPALPQIPDPKISNEPGDAAKVAQQFEAVLLQQLISVMRNTAKSGGLMSDSGASGQYLAMLDQALADQIAEGGGIGLARTFVTALDGGEDGEAETSSLGIGSRSLSMPLGPRAQSLRPTPTLAGATKRLAQAAYGLAARDGGKQWGREGTLTAADLGGTTVAAPAGEAAHFAVEDAQGYHESYKCNLFALEAARRAGFQVPLVARARGLGYPTSNTVTEDASDGSLRDNWATVVSPERVEQLTSMLERGEVALLLSGHGEDGRHGHMAVVEKIHAVKLGAHGEIDRIEFDGYEARVGGAEHLTRRTWNRQGQGLDQRLARNGFGNIEILALRPAEERQGREIPAQSPLTRSRLESPSSSSAPRSIP